MKYLCLLVALASLWTGNISAQTLTGASLSSLGANDVIDWAPQGPAGTNLPASFVTPSQAGNLATFSTGGQFSIFEQFSSHISPGANPAYVYAMNFDPGDILLWSVAPNYLEGQISVSLQKPVSGAGFNIGAFYLWWPFNVTVTAFDAQGHSLGSVTENGLTYSNSTTDTSGSAPFVGFVSSETDISAFDIQLQYTAAGTTGFFGGMYINSVLLNDAVAIPEPASYAVVIGICVGWAGIVKVSRKGSVLCFFNFFEVPKPTDRQIAATSS
jgi:hypothetical protein